MGGHKNPVVSNLSRAFWASLSLMVTPWVGKSRPETLLTRTLDCYGWTPWLPNTYIKSGRKNGMKLSFYPIVSLDFTKTIWRTVIILWDNERRYSSKQITYWSLLFGTFLYYEKEEPPVCVECTLSSQIKHILIECVDLVDVRKYLFIKICLFTLSERKARDCFF